MTKLIPFTAEKAAESSDDSSDVESVEEIAVVNEKKRKVVVVG